MSLDGNQRPAKIASVFPGSTAESAGVLAGDVVLAVDGADVSQLGLDQLIQRIKGPAGTVVTLTLSRNGEPLSLTIRRRAIEF
jgi:carboxyl-terminal processing protease